MKNRLAKIIFYLFACTAFACSNGNGDGTDPKTEPTKKEHFSGVWITNVASSVLDSRDNIRQAVEVCKESGINNIFMVVWNRGRTLYPSSVMKNTFGVEIADKFSGRDPLNEMIEEAHKKNIKVHAWFEYGFAASNNENGGLILQKKPEWAAKDVTGNLLKKNGFEWMNPFMPDVQNFMISLVMEVVQNYNIDGVQGDDRLPALPSTGGYDAYTVDLYKQEHNGEAPPADYKNTSWINWRADKLTNFLGKLYKMVKTAKPNVVVSCAPGIHPWSKNEYLQDWPSWLDKGYADMVIPQHYRYDIESYQAVLQQQLSFLGAKDRGKFFPGILIQNADYNPSLEFLNQMIQENRRQGITGEAFWFYEGINKFPSFFKNY